MLMILLMLLHIIVQLKQDLLEPLIVFIELVPVFIFLSEFNNIIIQWMKYSSNAHSVYYPISFNYISSISFGYESKSTGNGYTLHPCIQETTQTGFYFYMGQYGHSLDNLNSEYWVYFHVIGY